MTKTRNIHKYSSLTPNRFKTSEEQHLALDRQEDLLSTYDLNLSTSEYFQSSEECERQMVTGEINLEKNN